MANILAIDDESSCLEIINFILIAQEHKVFNATNGEDAIKFLKNNEHTIDLILLDMMMPAMNGLETFKQIRTIEHAKFIPIIFQTGASDYIQFNEISDQHNIDLVIKKPYKRADLINIINVALTSKEIEEIA